MKKKKRNYLIVLLLLVVGLSVGYALLQTTLTINGTSKIKGSSWNIHFENLNVTDGSVPIGTGDVAATIQSTNTDITYTITLNTPGDFYEFTVDAVNSGTVDGMIESVISKLNNTPITTLPAYLKYSVTYLDGVSIVPNQLLKVGSSETYKVRIEFIRDIENSDLPTTAQTLSFNFGVDYVQADSSSFERPVRPLANYDWDTIVNLFQKSNSCGTFKVGDTKEVDMGSFGTHTLRLANCSRPINCETSGYSQTACGVVLEFVDIVDIHRMHSTDTNVGGWPVTEMRTYLNNDVYNALPDVIKNAIIDTIVVSGHGLADENNYTSIDKIYLLSGAEIWGSGTATSVDTASSFSRQFDYYRTLEHTDYIWPAIVKQYNGSNSIWWLRSAYPVFSTTYDIVHTMGIGTSISASSYGVGVSPAFRIG